VTLLQHLTSSLEILPALLRFSPLSVKISLKWLIIAKQWRFRISHLFLEHFNDDFLTTP